MDNLNKPLMLVPQIVVFHSGVQSVHRLDRRAAVSIGRSAVSMICIDHHLVSTNHLLIRPTVGGYEFVDLGSTNGTYFNQKRMKSSCLDHGDVISLGGEVQIQYLVAVDNSSRNTDSGSEIALSR